MLVYARIAFAASENKSNFGAFVSQQSRTLASGIILQSYQTPQGTSMKKAKMKLQGTALPTLQGNTKKGITKNCKG